MATSNLRYPGASLAAANAAGENQKDLTASDIARMMKEMSLMQASPPRLIDPAIPSVWAEENLLRPGGIMRTKMEKEVPYGSSELEKMVRMRLRSPRGSYFQYWHMHKLNDEKVIVLVINNNQHTVLEDEWPMFPSDKLIAQLRLLEK